MTDETKTTRYGFMYGSTPKGRVNVARLHSDEKMGTLISIETKTQEFNVRITPGGKIIPLNVFKKKKKGFWHLAPDEAKL